jgi:hypothetical protein
MISPVRIFAVLVLSSWLATGCNRGGVSKLENGDALRADCSILMSKYPGGDIPKGAWPRSIKELKATRVVREKADVKIYVSEKPGNFMGYYVFLETQSGPPTRGIWIEKTPFKGIYQFKHY